MRRRILRLSLALCALGVGLVSAPAPAGAASVSKAAWWTRGSDPGSFVPPAAQVPGVTAPEAPVAPPTADAAEGEVVVQGAPNGALAIAAITYILSPGESGPTLTITPGEGSNVPSDAVILACRAAVDWEAPATQPGAWQDKPLVDCGRSVNGIVAPDGTSITFALQPLVSGTDLDVVLTPGTTGETTPAGPVGSTFQLTFNATDAAVLATTSAPSSSSGSSSSSSESSSSPSFSPSPSPAVGGTTFTPPASPVVQPALEPQEQAPTVPQVAAPPTQPASATDDDTARGVGFIILLAGAALAGWAYLTPERRDGGDASMIGLGRFRRPAPAAAFAEHAAEPVTGGLGRFSRLRSGPPPSLS